LAADPPTECLQAELDRRFAALADMSAERLNNIRDAAGTMQAELDRRFATINQRFKDNEKLLDERYATQTKALDAAFKAAEQAVQVALANAEKAVTKAEVASDKRFEAVNEFRQTLSDQTASFPTRNEVKLEIDSVRHDVTRNTERITEVSSRMDLDQGADTQEKENRASTRESINTKLIAATVIISVVVVIVNVFIHLAATS
jgi:DNA repair exonuclease SbcCD ATPase subunit